MIPREAIVRAARSFIGTPYQHQGRSEFGMDCAGLVIQTGKRVGAIPQNFDCCDYGRNPIGRLEPLMSLCMDEKPGYHLKGKIQRLKPGDVVAIKWFKLSHHVAIVATANISMPYATLIHCHQRNKGCAEHRLNDYYLDRITGVWDFRGVAP